MSLINNKTINLKRQSIFKDIILCEPVDANLLEKITNSDLVVSNDDWDEKKQLNMYSNNITNDYATVKYTQSSLVVGRVNPDKQLGLHSIRRQTRHTLVNGVMTDIDIQNCHPELLNQIVNVNGLDCKNLSHYCSNRTDFLNEIIKFYKLDDCVYCKYKTYHEKHTTPKDIAKNLIIRLLNGGTIDIWKDSYGIELPQSPHTNAEGIVSLPAITGCKELPIISGLTTEIKNIQKWICDSNPDLYKLCKDKNETANKHYNHEGTTTSIFLQDIECQVLEQVYEFLVDNDYIKNDICSLCNDGIMIEEKHYRPEVLSELNQYIYDTTGFNLIFVKKEMKDGYKEILNDHINFDLWKQEYNDGLYADYFKLFFYEKFIVVGGNLFFYNGVFWERDATKSRLSAYIDNDFRTILKEKAWNVKDKIAIDMKEYDKVKDSNTSEKENFLKKMIAKWGQPSEESKTKGGDICDSLLLEKDKKIMTYWATLIDKHLRNVTSRDRLVKDCMRVLENNCVNFDTNEFLLAFTNKIYNLENATWIEPQFNQYISLTTGWKWVNGYKKSKKADLLKLIDTLFTDKVMRDFYLQVLSTGIYGKVIQHFFVAKGGGGNGKSLINSLMMTTLGEYAYKLPSSVVSQPIKEGANPAIANMNNKRFTLFQEPEKKLHICCSTIKEITGDKEINARTLYSTDTVTHLKCSLLGEFNELPKLDETTDAMDRRLMVIEFTSKFLNHAQYEALSDEDKQNPQIHKANPYYTTDKFQEEHKQALIEILFDSFKEFKEQNYILIPPQKVVDESKKYLMESDAFYDSFWKDNFEPSENEYVKWTDIWECFRKSSFYNNMPKANKINFSKSKVKEIISVKHRILKKCWKERQRKFNNQKLDADSITGWTIRETDDDSYNGYN
tara:strand:+ start:1406 stop:4096 length:2691 start_codon:yes stop_codon:yes gene_type:complete